MNYRNDKKSLNVHYYINAILGLTFVKHLDGTNLTTPFSIAGTKLPVNYFQKKYSYG